jgi:hypothetical protein
MNRALAWVIGAVLVIGAGAVTVFTPAEDDASDPFLIRGAAGDTVTSRTLVVTPGEASFAERVTVTGADWQAEGNWLVVTLTVSAPQTEVDAAILLATLVIDERVFQASERPATSLAGTQLHVGTDTVGVLAFELPPDLQSGTGELRLSTSYFSPRLDDVTALPVSLDGLPTAPSIELEPPSLSAP